jgi:S-DNA-T family DNA segregation ATPase FtsK/SpoIIIE
MHDQPADRVRLSLVKDAPAELAEQDDIYPILEGEVVGEDEEYEDYESRPPVVIEHGAYVVAGVTTTVRRLRESRSTVVYDRGIGAAQSTGDHATALEWVKERREFQADRHARRFDWIELPAKVIGFLRNAGMGCGGLLVVVGVLLAIATKDATKVVAPIVFIADAVELTVVIVSVTWLYVLIAAPIIAVLTLWAIGRRAVEDGDVEWMAAGQAGDSDKNIIVTADSIVLALQHLRIPEVKKAFKDGWVPKFHQLPVRDGRGYHCVVELPLGVTAEMVADLRPVLARNLYRAQIETWPSDAEKVGTGPAGYLDLWVADAGALSKAAPEYPLLHEGKVDVFKGIPGGVSPRGDLITIPVIGKNIVAGGQMGQGKSNACRVIMLGCSLDPIVELNVFVFAANGDFDSYRPRLTRYHRGIDDENAYEALEHLRWLYDEVARREGRLADLGAKKVTRGLAEKHPDLRPIVSLFSECHELFGHKEFGEEAGELACKTAKRARKTAIVEMFDTQSSRKGAIPPALIELMSVNACFYVKNWRNNDGFLGDGCFAAGIRATELRPGRDVGTSLVIGVSDAAYELLKWYFVEVNDDTGWDAATEVIARAVANMASGVGAGTAAAIEPPEVRDLLDDLDEVLGLERVTLADVPRMLRELAPHWIPYQKLKGTTGLREDLAALGVKAVRSGGTWYLDPEVVRAALSERSTADLDA